MTVTKEKFFRQAKVSPQDKISATDLAAREITAAETANREKKTEKLRALRLAQPVVEPVKPLKKKRQKSD
jgi:hypothetical protein